ncbi:MAG TPA: CRTAC1 family protein [Acidobacteriota bacterium]|nr:CRTAC1 family protein [Acidobacteriota bacterium]
MVTYTGGSEKNHILESTGNGVIVFDYDGDFDQDVYFVNAFRFPSKGKTEPHSNALYRNDGKGKFTDVTKSAGVGAAVYGQGGCVGDVNNDGLPDLFITNFGPDILYKNNGDGSFSDITAAANVGDPRWSIGCTFFDADKDGDHDLYVANYVDATWQEIHSAKRTRQWRGKVPVLDGPKGLPGSVDSFYINNGNETFTEAHEKSGLKTGSEYYGMSVASFDYDNDGDIDLYVANDSTPNCLYRNKGNGTFEEVGTPTGTAYNADGEEQGSMGIGFGDFDNDGWFDLIVTNFAHDYYTLYHNHGGKFFTDDSFASGIAVPTFVPLGWAALFLDVDQDRDLDIFFSNGHIYPQVDQDRTLDESYRQKNILFLNEGNGRFRDVSGEAGSGFQLQKSARGGAYADFDLDGDLDLIISNQDDKPTYLENRSQLAGNHWITLLLNDTKGSPLALGARVIVTAEGVSQHRQISSGGSYASQSELNVHYGLGNSSTVQRIEIIWPDGAKETHSNVRADQFYLIKRGGKPILQRGGGAEVRR